MTVDERIKTALAPFGDDVENGEYLGEHTQYYTFNYSTYGTDYGDDAPEHEIYLVQVHFFAPLSENITARKKATKKALFDAGFTWPEIIPSSDEDGQHIVFECEIAEGVDSDGPV